MFKHADATKLPFNYVRSLMLFESNDELAKALAQPNSHGLTPVACYIAYANKPSTPVKHEFSALLALMEIEQKQNPNAKQQLANVIKGQKVNETTNFTERRLLATLNGASCSLNQGALIHSQLLYALCLWHV
ncbi:hypothetical protein P4S63_08055 [Pseudoalteromonas sp. B193]